MTSNFIIDVTEEDFEYEVLSYSQNLLVVVDFWATWCKPCKTLSPLLESLAYEAMGGFRLAKVDVDANPNLAMQYGVRTVPTVKAFSVGQVVADFVGNQPEERVRAFLANIAPPSQNSLSLEKADSFLANHQWGEAEEIYRELLDQHPDHPAALFGLAKSLLGAGDPFESLLILRNFPTSRFFSKAESLLPYAESLGYLKQNSLPQDDDLDIAFANTIRLAARGNIQAALDGLLDILRSNKRYRNGLANKVFVSLLEILGEEHEETRAYRAELSSVLF